MPVPVIAAAEAATMVRVPRGLTSPAGAYAPNRLGWGPAVRPIQRLPIQLYTRPITSVPLIGGQAQGVIPSYAQASGTLTSPAAFTTLTQVTAPSSGTYTIKWTVTLSGTLGAPEVNNFRLTVSGAAGPLAGNSVNPAAAGTYVQTPVTTTLIAGQIILLQTGSNTPTTGATYGGILPQVAAPLLLSVGPQGIGNVWTPASLTVQTTTGVNDFSICNVYLGPAGAGITLLGTIYPGGIGTSAFALPVMSPGQYLITIWTGANPGDTATVNVVGTMNSLMPG